LLEGSFGNEKNHYLLDKISARNQETEVLWIFFDIMTANAVQLGKRMALSKKSRKAG
jgi:transposase, IS5 family